MARRMSRTITPHYRLEVIDPQGGVFVTDWKGRPTQARLEQYLMGLGRSFEPGGVNFHVSQARGYIPYPVRARIVEQRTGRVVSEWTAPAFLVW